MKSKAAKTPPSFFSFFSRPFSLFIFMFNPQASFAKDRSVGRLPIGWLASVSLISLQRNA